MPDLAQLERDLRVLEQDKSLDNDVNFQARFQALHTLDFLEKALRTYTPQPTNRQGQPLTMPLHRALARRADLERRNSLFYHKLRAGVRAGTITALQVRTLLQRNSRYQAGQGPACLHWGAEAADELAAGLFHSDCLPHPWNASHAEMIHYETTPVSVLLELVDRVPLTAEDTFVDIGSGLGQVVLLVHLLTGVEAVGLEVMPAFVKQARHQAATLGLNGVVFEQGDARCVDLGAGTVYFLFSPFRGEMLQTVIARLRQEASERPLTICSFGPCTEWIATGGLALQEPEMNHEFRLGIFHCHSQ